MGERRGVYRVLMGKPEGERERERERERGGGHLEGPGLRRRIILKLIFRKWCIGAWTGSIWLRIGTGDGHL